MTKCQLNFTNAYTGRINAQDATSFESRADSVAARLSEETGSGKLPFINYPFWGELQNQLAELYPFLKRFDHLLVLGIGGSALGARALQRAFAPGQDMPGHTGPWLWIGDNINPFELKSWTKNLPPERTLVVTISKSGGTIETISQYFLLKEWLSNQLPDAWKDHLLLVTDKEKGFLREEAQTHGIRTFPVPENLGGRYSVLSAVGLIPALFLGIDVNELMNGALAVSDQLIQHGVSASSLKSHPSWSLACWARALMDKEYSQLIFFTYHPLWNSFGDWFGQLWAESLGKEGKGSMPLPAVGVTDQHSLQQMFLQGPKDKGCLFLTCPAMESGAPMPADLPGQWSYLKGKRFGDIFQAETLGTRMAMTETDIPLVEVRLGGDSPYEAGKTIVLLETATLLTGWLMEIDPLNQPGVELGKRLAKARLGVSGLDDEKQRLTSFLEQSGNLQEF